MNIKKHLFYFFLLVTLHVFSQEEEYINVSDMSEYNEAIKKAVPGTTILLKSGIWEDVHLRAYGKGTKENPITIKAKKAGEVILTGSSRLQIYGEYIVIEGLWFKEGKPSNQDVVSFKKNSEEFANNCRFTNNAITYYNPSYHGFKTHWVGLWGKNNRVDHNNFTGKKNEGTTLVVWLKGEEHIENNHRIDSNFFGLRPDLGRTSAETIRIGTSKYSMQSSKTIVENNTFKNCNGELEIISNKSCDNIYRNNLFLESKGALTLRHGNNTLVENNVFIGNNKPHTGGIRIGNKGNIVRNNLLVGITGKANRAPIAIMNGIPNSPLNGYHQVEDTNIQNNTLINCSSMRFGANRDAKKTLPPITTVFANNLIKNRADTKALDANQEIERDGVEFKNNIIETTGEFNRYLFKNTTIDWFDLKSIPIPTQINTNLNSDFINDKSPTVDIVGSKKEPFTVGAFNLGNNKLPKALQLNSGTSWDTKVVVPKFKGRIVTVEPGIATLNEAIKNASEKTLFMLRDGFYYIDKEQKINGDITIQGNKNTIIVAKENLEKPFKSFFKINENSRLNLKNLTIDGEVSNIKYAIISPSKGASYLYSLFIDNCIIKNFNHEHGYIFRSYANTVADTIKIKNSHFSNSYRGINFHSKENTGAINANHIKIDNTVFESIQNFALKYIKPASAKDKIGKLNVSNCVFSNVNNKEKGRILDIKEIPFTAIKNCVFEKSSEIINPISLSGGVSLVDNCLVYSCGEIKTSKGAIQKNIINKSPKWKDKKNFIPKSRSPLLKQNNNIDNIGLLE